MLERLNAHRDWANERLIAWYLALPEGEDYCLRMLSHILAAEETWVGRVLGKSHRDPRGALLAPGELEPLRRTLARDWEAVLAGDAERFVRYHRLDGEEAGSTVAEIALQACTHGAYHRGQIAAQAARAGRKVPPTDFIVFARS